MALQSSGEISLSDVNVELGNSSTAEISLGDSAVRGLFGVASGQIRLAADGYGKSNVFTFSITAAQTDANLATLATAAGWDGSTAVEATIDSGVYISSTSTSTPALTISGFSGGVTLINNGYIVGKGGNGGNGGNSYGNSIVGGGSSGSSGGLGLSVSTACTIDNTNGVIAGGGGGGGGGGGARGYVSVGEDNLYPGCGGGGGGGGRSSNSSSSGGPGGTAYYNNHNASGSSGNGGTLNAAGNGGGGGSLNVFGKTTYAGNGGTAGTWGASGSSGNSGGGNANPIVAPGGGSGGGAGACTSGSATYITWTATGTRYGTIG